MFLDLKLRILKNYLLTNIQVAHCCSVANGTDAIELALRALGVGAGDKVATVANAGMYTSTAILSIGGIPFFLDVDLVTKTVMKSEIERAIQQRVKAIVVTHLYGQAQLDISEIATICKYAGVVLLEDCAQAHGARINGRKVGSFGDAGCFSFYPTKNLGALGDGGAVVCSDAEIFQNVKYLRQYGWTSKYKVELPNGRNSRLDELQAAVLSEFLPYLDSWNLRRREIASKYSQLITHPAVILPLERGEDYVAHLFVVRSIERDRLSEYLRRLNIATDVHYPVPDYHQPLFGNCFSTLRLPNTECLAQETLTLPCYPEMAEADVEMVISAINHWEVNPYEKGIN